MDFNFFVTSFTQSFTQTKVVCFCHILSHLVRCVLQRRASPQMCSLWSTRVPCQCLTLRGKPSLPAGAKEALTIISDPQPFWPVTQQHAGEGYSEEAVAASTHALATAVLDQGAVGENASLMRAAAQMYACAACIGTDAAATHLMQAVCKDMAQTPLSARSASLCPAEARTKFMLRGDTSEAPLCVCYCQLILRSTHTDYQRAAVST